MSDSVWWYQMYAAAGGGVVISRLVKQLQDPEPMRAARARFSDHQVLFTAVRVVMLMAVVALWPLFLGLFWPWSEGPEDS